MNSSNAMSTLIVSQINSNWTLNMPGGGLNVWQVQFWHRHCDIAKKPLPRCADGLRTRDHQKALLTTICMRAQAARVCCEAVDSAVAAAEAAAQRGDPTEATSKAALAAWRSSQVRRY